MKLRIFLTALTFGLDYIAQSTYKMFYSPITAVASAQALNDDSTQGYAVAKFIREGGGESSIFVITLLALVAICISPICNACKTKTN